ncbi:MAG: MraY family glycosyltransferase [Bacteroidales bacterium]|nr:MraY family glycosyltransferase [Bacteroidales bacterium]
MIDLLPYIGYTIPFAVLLSFFLTFFSIPYVVRVARKHNILVYPNHRDVHQGGISRMGGLSIFLSLVFCLIFFSGINTILYFRSILTGVIILFFFGLYDDLMELSPWKKILGEVMAATLVIAGAQMRFSNLYGFLGIYELGLVPSVLLTIFVFVAIINAFNLIDGIDGLAAGMGIETSLLFGFFFIVNGATRFATLCAILIGSLAAFFYFNVYSKKFKLFMGDSGSLVVGFLIGLMAWRFNELMIEPGISFRLNAAPVIAMGFLTIPLYDTLRVMVVRIRHRKSPFSADRLHVHHILLSLGFSHRKVRIFLLTFNLLMALLSIFLQHYIHNVIIILGILLAICLILTFWLLKIRDRQQKNLTPNS